MRWSALRRTFHVVWRRTLCTDAESSSSRLLEIWAWGKGDAAQLGGNTKHLKTPQIVARVSVPPNVHLARMQGLINEIPVHKLYKSPQVERINDACDGAVSSLGLASGLFHSALLVDGEVWTWGKGDGGRLGIGTEEPKYSLEPSNPLLPPLQSVALGGLHSAAITKTGDLYTWGFGAFGAVGHGRYKAEFSPRKLVLGDDERVTYVSGGGSHTAAITACGNLYTWGRDEGEGRLGHGPTLVTDEGAVNIPLKVKSLPEQFVVVSCGGFFTTALTSNGQVWSWGANNNHELGRGDTKSRSQPSMVPALESVPVVQVACGGYHSAALTADGKVLTWGHGKNGQLGHGTLTSAKEPTVVEALEHLQVAYIACGSFTTAAVTETGAMFCWGKNSDCQLGFQGKLDAESLPHELSFDDGKSSSGRSVIAVALGASHGVCLVLQ